MKCHLFDAVTAPLDLAFPHFIVYVVCRGICASTCCPHVPNPPRGNMGEDHRTAVTRHGAHKWSNSAWRFGWGLPYMTSTKNLVFFTPSPPLYAKSVPFVRKFGVFLFLDPFPLLFGRHIWKLPWGSSFGSAAAAGGSGCWMG